MTSPRAGNARRLLRVGEVASAAGVGVQTLHYYERKGLLPKARRSAAGYREYEPTTIARVRAIKRAQSLGFTLEEIGRLTRGRTGRRADGLIELVQRKLGTIDAQLADLRAVRARLTAALEACRCGGDLARCDVIGPLESDHEAAKPEPRDTGRRSRR